VELTTSLIDSYFTQFKRSFGKTYEHEQEEAHRREHFEASIRRAQQKNKDQGSNTFGVTKFSDMSPEEFSSKMLTHKPKEGKRFGEHKVKAARRVLRGSTPDSHDCRDDGAVTAVKDQGQCGSCWAFSTAEEVESAYFMAGNPLTELSVAQIVQCDTGGDDAGCRGGDTVSGFDYVGKAGGLALDKDYPYPSSMSRGRTGSCQDGFDVVSGTSVKEYRYATKECYDECENQDEETLAANLAADGPVSICVDASSWQVRAGEHPPDSAPSPNPVSSFARRTTPTASSRRPPARAATTTSTTASSSSATTPRAAQTATGSSATRGPTTGAWTA
jgi:hypothetical protein